MSNLKLFVGFGFGLKPIMDTYRLTPALRLGLTRKIQAGFSPMTQQFETHLLDYDKETFTPILAAL